MSKLTRIFALAVILIGTYSAATQKPQSLAGVFGYGSPIPMCDPGNPQCSIEPKQ